MRSRFMNNLTNNPPALVDGAAVIFLLAISFYIFLRAYILSITHDEALTVISQGTTSYLNIFLYKKGIPANNHLINSLLVRFVIGLFGYNEFFIRISGLIGGLLYFIFTYKLTRKLFFRTILFPLSLSLLVLNPYILDFFSLARGYGLSLGFMMASLFYFFDYYQKNYPQYTSKIIMSFVLMALAVISNFSFLNVFVSLIGAYLIIEFIVAFPSLKKMLSLDALNDNLKKELLYIVTITIALALLIFYPLRKMAKTNEFYGGNIGFWHDTGTSLIKASIYKKEYIPLIFIHFFIIIIILFLFIDLITIILYKENLDSSDKGLIIISSIIILTGSSIVFQNILIGTPFLTLRTAICFIPLFTLLVFILWKSLLKNKFKNLWFFENAFIFICGAIILFHYISCINLSHTYDWRYDASTKNAMHQIFAMEKGKDSGKDIITIGATWSLVPSIDFYILKHRGSYKFIVPKGQYTLGPDRLDDYYYVLACDKKILNKYHAILLDHYTLSNTYLGMSKFLKQFVVNGKS